MVTISITSRQRREFLRIFICNLKMYERNIPVLPNFSLTISRSLSQAGQGEGRQEVYQADYQVHCNGPKEKHPSSGYIWRLSLLEKTLFVMEMFTSLMIPRSHSGILKIQIYTYNIYYSSISTCNSLIVHFDVLFTYTGRRTLPDIIISTLFFHKIVKQNVNFQSIPYTLL